MSQAQMTEIVCMLVDNLTSRFWLLVVVQLVVAAVAAFAGAYLAQKGKNRTDSEDIGELFWLIEAGKNLAQPLRNPEEDQAKAQHFAAQLEKTTEAYRTCALLMGNGLDNRVNGFLETMLKMELSIAQLQVENDTDGILKGFSDAFREASRLLAEIKDAARNALRSEEVEL